MKRMIWMLAALALLLGGIGQANAGYFLITSRTGFSDFVDWGQLGAPYTDPSNPSTVTSNGGKTLTVSQTYPGAFERRDEGNGWNGNFSPGDHLLWTNNAGSSAPNTLSISSGFTAGGAQIQADYYGSFTARITAYDAMGNTLASFTENGTSNGNNDGSAIFIGIGTTSGTIASIGFSLDSATFGTVGDFAINKFSFSTGPYNVIPEPASVTLLGLGALGLAGFGLRRRKQNAAVS